MEREVRRRKRHSIVDGKNVWRKVYGVKQYPVPLRTEGNQEGHWLCFLHSTVRNMKSSRALGQWHQKAWRQTAFKTKIPGKEMTPQVFTLHACTHGSATIRLQIPVSLETRAGQAPVGKKQSKDLCQITDSSFPCSGAKVMENRTIQANFPLSLTLICRTCHHISSPGHKKRDYNKYFPLPLIKIRNTKKKIYQK